MTFFQKVCQLKWLFAFFPDCQDFGETINLHRFTRSDIRLGSGFGSPPMRTSWHTVKWISLHKEWMWWEGIAYEGISLVSECTAPCVSTSATALLCYLTLWGPSHWRWACPLSHPNSGQSEYILIVVLSPESQERHKLRLLSDTLKK